MSAASELKRLLPQHDRLQAQLAQVRRRIDAAEIKFSDELGCKVRLRPEAIRRALEARG